VIISRRSKQREVSPRRRDRLIASSNANTKSRAFSLSLSLSLSLSSERVDVPRLRGQAPRTGDPSIRIARGGNERLTFSTPFHLARCSSPFLPSSLSLSLSLSLSVRWLPRLASSKNARSAPSLPPSFDRHRPRWSSTAVPPASDA